MRPEYATVFRVGKGLRARGRYLGGPIFIGGSFRLSPFDFSTNLSKRRNHWSRQTGGGHLSVISRIVPALPLPPMSSKRKVPPDAPDTEVTKKTASSPTAEEKAPKTLNFDDDEAPAHPRGGSDPDALNGR